MELKSREKVHEIYLFHDKVPYMIIFLKVKLAYLSTKERKLVASVFSLD